MEWIGWVGRVQGGPWYSRMIWSQSDDEEHREE